MEFISEIKISVRNLVEFILRSGSIYSGFVSNVRAVEGTRAHQKIQKQNKESYIPEVAMVHNFQYGNYYFTLEGRADGVIVEDNEITIDEIKTTSTSLDQIDENFNDLHWAQAKCYGFMYGEQNNVDKIHIQLTYYNIESDKIKKMQRLYLLEELREFVYDLLDKYIVWAEFTIEWKSQRNNSITNLNFPFESYRKGQRQLAVGVYKTIKEKKNIFIQAPTGIGKTISTLFPSVKAVGEGFTSKIFYLTAKTITRQAAQEACQRMMHKGLKLKVVTLTAKEKICFKDKPNCNPEHCEFANGHFDRVNNGILDVLRNEDLISRDIIEKYCRKHCVCPFEFSLDLAVWSDCVICDYNYAFDPRIYLKRFFTDSKSDYTFLIDEAHNLLDRGREMFSAELFKKNILDLKKLMKNKDADVAKALKEINEYMINLKKACTDEKHYISKEENKEVYTLLENFVKASEKWLSKCVGSEEYDSMLELYFQVQTFLKISDFYDERYVTYAERRGNDLRLKLFCLDPSYLLSQAIKRSNSAIFFSATLTPIEYFRDVLGGSNEDYLMKLPSPFNRDNLCLLIGDKISTRYRNRDNSYDAIVEYIYNATSLKKGNYLVFLPSYKYMDEVYKRFVEKHKDINTVVQFPEMGEEERELFLEKFIPDTEEGLIGFGVLGGIFSEGIDLKGERLIGAIIVGVGLPQISLERDIIRDYYHKRNSQGYEYAYMYPGMNKVLQAAGRVIRTENDKGAILLIDERFSHSAYKKLFPKEWNHKRYIQNSDVLCKILKDFWEKY